jgi:hypothetical protein
MRLGIAVLILGSIVTSASAAGTDIHGLVDAQTGHTVISEQQSTQNLPKRGRRFSPDSWGHRTVNNFGYR